MLLFPLAGQKVLSIRFAEVTFSVVDNGKRELILQVPSEESAVTS
jgi:hypothetical protein